VNKVLVFLNFLFLIPIYLYGKEFVDQSKITGAPFMESASKEEALSINKYDWIYNWSRPAGPVKVGLQVGHLNNDEFPEELARLRDNNGASAAGYSEWEINLEIAELTQKILKQNEIEVEIIPATVPPNYWADVFLAIHADGSEDFSKSGFKIAEPWRDFSNQADDLVHFLTINYSQVTGLMWDPNITRNMRGYYAFNFWKFEHAIHPMTTAAIIETGFLTNKNDRQLLTQNPEIVAQGIGEGIIQYLKSIKLM